MSLSMKMATLNNAIGYPSNSLHTFKKTAFTKKTIMNLIVFFAYLK